MNRDEIKQILPHREPMLLLDEVYLDEETKTAHGTYAVTGEEWFVSGHFPGNPVVPGVILCEMMGQSCCVLLGNEARGKTPLFTGMKNVRFRGIVRPGDVIQTKCSLTRQRAPFYFAECEARVGGKLVAEAEISFALTEGL
jgi:3-hydroxyacyl-[acyl-carrier-protein] dehydratase